MSSSYDAKPGRPKREVERMWTQAHEVRFLYSIGNHRRTKAQLHPREKRKYLQGYLYAMNTYERRWFEDADVPALRKLAETMIEETYERQAEMGEMDCPHGNDPTDCHSCFRDSDHAFDAYRETH